MSKRDKFEGFVSGFGCGYLVAIDFLKQNGEPVPKWLKGRMDIVKKELDEVPKG